MISLPATVRREVSKLPAVARDVINQSLKRAPPSHIGYENAIKQLMLITEAPEVLRKGFLAADALALWGRMYNDNRALIAAQKIKAVALRQMFIVAAEIGDASKILRAEKVHAPRIELAKKFASYPTQKAAEDAMDRMAAKVRRVDDLVRETAKESPLGRKQRADRLRKLRTSERERDRNLQSEKHDTALRIKLHLEEAERELSYAKYDMHKLLIDECKVVKAKITDIMELLDEMDQMCDSGARAGAERKRA